MSVQMSISQMESSHFSLFLVGGSFSSWWALNTWIRLHLSSDSRKDPRFSWKLRNTLVSFIHSSLTGLWAPLCFTLHPGLSSDLFKAYDLNVHSLIAVSLGYFLYDFVDMSLQLPATQFSRKITQLLLHHFTVILCFSISVSTRTFLPYASLSLFIELNSIFLHARQLLILRGDRGRAALLYGLVSYLNVGTFIAFRMLLMAYLAKSLLFASHLLPGLTASIVGITLFIILILNVQLFQRILASDFGLMKKPSSD